jgi:hypothetical protein
MPEAPKKEELEMWRVWKKDSTMTNLEPLLVSLDPLIQKRVNQFSGAPIPRSAIEAEARKNCGSEPW